MEMEYASKTVANAGLTTGIIGTALGAMGTGLLGGLTGGNNQYVSKEVFDTQVQLIDTQKENAILKADLNTETKIVDAFKASVERENKIREELKEEIRAVDKKITDNIASQAVINCQMSSQIGLNTSQIAQLFAMTKMVIPNANICPGWDRAEP